MYSKYYRHWRIYCDDIRERLKPVLAIGSQCIILPIHVVEFVMLPKKSVFMKRPVVPVKEKVKNDHRYNGYYNHANCGTATNKTDVYYTGPYSNYAGYVIGNYDR
jgi:hypothetical protein